MKITVEFAPIPYDHTCEVTKGHLVGKEDDGTLVLIDAELGCTAGMDPKKFYILRLTKNVEVENRAGILKHEMFFKYTDKDQAIALKTIDQWLDDETKPENMFRDLCPWCKTKGRFPHVQTMIKHGTDEVVTGYACWCSKCGCEGPIGKTEVEAINLWNEASQTL